jgi:hypothetical protein
MLDLAERLTLITITGDQEIRSKLDLSWNTQRSGFLPLMSRVVTNSTTTLFPPDLLISC